jgi:hypothetical protein
MQDFDINNLRQAKCEYSVRLIDILTPRIKEGFYSIFDKAWELCLTNNEIDKYLLTYQNLLIQIPKWNNVLVQKERERIINKSGCNYLADLITAIHVIQLKVLTCVKVGNKQKKIDISIPNLDTFIHKVYINTARLVYTNVYLFEKKIPKLQIQKNNRELENIIQECILYTIRESIPTEQIVRAYLDESEEIEEEIIIEDVTEPIKEPEQEPELIRISEKNSVATDSFIPTITDIDDKNVITKISFNDFDSVLDENKTLIEAPKNVERLEEISTSRALQRKLEEEEEEEEESQSKIKITDENVDELDILDIDSSKNLNEDINLDFDSF